MVGLGGWGKVTLLRRQCSEILSLPLPTMEFKRRIIAS